MELEIALKIPGWTSEAELRWLAEQASLRKNILEVGSWMGRSAAAMAANTQGTVTAVDTWAGTAGDRVHEEQLAGKGKDWLFRQFLKHTKPYQNIHTIRQSSQNASTTVADRKFDMIFLDGAHDYDSVKTDLQAWIPLLESGGLLCGHDFDGGRPGVVQAVRELVPNLRKVGIGSLWAGGS